MATRRRGIQEVRVDQVNRERRDEGEAREGRTERIKRHDEGAVNTWWILTDRTWADGLVDTQLLEQK